jgi:acetolactate decarboxylase
VGYWFPQYLSTLSAPGYHFHFISEDRQIAGHMLDCNLESGTISFDTIEQVNVRLPGTNSFAGADMTTKP